MKRKCMRWMALGFLMSIVLSITGTFAAIGEKETIKMKVGDQEIDIDMEFLLSDVESAIQIELYPTHEGWINMLDAAFPDKEDALEDIFCALGLIEMLQECGGEKSKDELHGYLEEIGFSGELYESAGAENESYKFSDSIWVELTYEEDKARYIDATLFISAFDTQHNEIERFEILVQF